MLSRVKVLAVAAMTTIAVMVSAQQETPESVIRALVLAMYSNDVATYERLTLPDPRLDLLVRGGSVNEEAKAELEQHPEALQLRVMRPYQLAGRDVVPDSSGHYPVGTTVRFSAVYRYPMVVSLVMTADGWRVDPRWWLEMIEMADSSPVPDRDSADAAARALIATLLALDRDAAARIATPGANLDVLFAGAPSEPEPSDQLWALLAEMPLVEIGPGEYSEMPSGRVVEGVRRDDMKVLVGLYGPLEMGFVIQRVDGSWRVQPEPYFKILSR